MKYRSKLVLSLIIVSACFYAKAQKPQVDKNGNLVSMDNVEIFSMIQPIPLTNIFSDKDYDIWCGSVIKGKNGKFYMFYSRWPRKDGHYAWVNKSEIALARADKPAGPYKHLKVVLKARGNQYWDGTTTHNPYVIVHKGKYYLYYMGTTGKSTLKQPITMADKNWWEYRNNQRIGVAVADNPEAEFKRFDKPVLDASFDSTAFDAMMVNNPAVAVNDKGKVILIYKSTDKKAPNGSKVSFGVAFANAPLGPFTKHPEPIFTFKDLQTESVKMLAEDPYIWFYKGKYYAIVRDVVDYFNKGKSTLALLQSRDGIDWQASKYPAVAPYKLKFADGTFSEDKIERPWLYREKGVPIILFGAMGVNNREHSINVAVPLK
ncbi:glycoside hydrolase family protein [Pedobacter frigoris]|uniref:glycoside hydrolase family protein n=1 Tax=Pedobacter frigoris TaxID=2571272 RepID=UPI002930D0FF|nr:glycoside hydrolase family protein [Pedobacter frigoris]